MRRAGGGKADKKKLKALPAKRARRKNWAKKALALPKAKEAAPPSGPFEPQLAKLGEAPPQGDQWVHEIKWDGYRILATVADGAVRLWSRNALEWTDKVPEIRDAVAELGLTSAALDGELIAGSGTKEDFNLLQATLSGERQGALAYHLGRSDDWRKTKQLASDEFAVVGYTAPKGSRSGFGSLLLAKPDAKHGWLYVGRVGTGFSDALIKDVSKRIQGGGKKPTAYVPTEDTDLRSATWFEPRFVVEVWATSGFAWASAVSSAKRSSFSAAGKAQRWLISSSVSFAVNFRRTVAALLCAWSSGMMGSLLVSLAARAFNRVARSSEMWMSIPTNRIARGRWVAVVALSPNSSAVAESKTGTAFNVAWGPSDACQVRSADDVVPSDRVAVTLIKAEAASGFCLNTLPWIDPLARAPQTCFIKRA